MSERPKIGLALSGASGRALAHAGVLDVFDEEGIKIDYLCGCSSGAILAGSYACGTLPQFKKFALSLNKKSFWSLLRAANSTSGLLSLDNARGLLKTFVSGNIENARPHTSFAAVDIDSGKVVAVSMGDMANGIIASCSVPGLFEPVKWGNMHLVDGGLLNIVPAHIVKEMGADIVISVDIAASKYVFSDRAIKRFQWILWLARGTGLPYYYAKKTANHLKSFLSRGNYIQFSSQSDFIDESQKLPNVLHIISKVVELSKRRELDTVPFEPYSDIIIEPKVKHYGKTEFNMAQSSYLEGRRAAKAALPQLRKLMSEYGKQPEPKKALKTKQLTTQGAISHGH